MGWDKKHPQNRKNTDRYYKPFAYYEEPESPILHKEFPEENYEEFFRQVGKCCDHPLLMMEYLSEDRMDDDFAIINLIAIYCMWCNRDVGAGQLS